MTKKTAKLQKCARDALSAIRPAAHALPAMALCIVFPYFGFPARAAEMPADTQTQQSQQFYTPQIATQTAPMHVAVLNGDTFRDVATGDHYRLYGVDVCARDQQAILDKQPWACGAVSMAWLIKATLGQWVVCTTIRKEHAVKVARCATSQYPDVAQDMLIEGLAIRPPDTADQGIPAYAQAQATARAHLVGIWGSKFQMPWDYRKNRVPPPPPSISPDIPTRPNRPSLPEAPKIAFPRAAPAAH